MSLFMFLMQIQDTAIQVQNQVANTTAQTQEVNWVNIILALIGTGGILYMVIQSLLKQRDARIAGEIEQKKKKVEGEIEVTKENAKHENALDVEKFNLEKQKDLKRLEDNEVFQKDIINKIFDKYVKQNDWITTIYEKKFEELTSSLMEIKREVKDMRVLSDKMNMQIRNVDEKVIKNTNIIIAKTDALLKVFANLIFTEPKDAYVDISETEKKKIQRQTEEIKITEE